MAQRGAKARIDLIELEKLCSMQCTDEEIAAWFKVTTRTIERRRKVKAFRDVMERGKARGRISVRRQQMKMLEEGNSTMGVWLGKQILGQMDVVRPLDNQIKVLFVVPRPDSGTDAANQAQLATLNGTRLIEPGVIDTEMFDGDD